MYVIAGAAVIGALLMPAVSLLEKDDSVHLGIYSVAGACMGGLLAFVSNGP